MVESDEEAKRRSERVPDEEYARRMAALDRMMEIRQQAIDGGMNLLNDEEILAEVRRRRYGDPDEA